MSAVRAIAFNSTRDADLLAHLDQQANVSRYVRELIRRDMEGGGWDITPELRGLVAQMIEQALQNRQPVVPEIPLPKSRGMLG